MAVFHSLTHITMAVFHSLTHKSHGESVQSSPMVLPSPDSPCPRNSPYQPVRTGRLSWPLPFPPPPPPPTPPSPPSSQSLMEARRPAEYQCPVTGLSSHAPDGSPISPRRPWDITGAGPPWFARMCCLVICGRYPGDKAGIPQRRFFLWKSRWRFV